MGAKDADKRAVAEPDGAGAAQDFLAATAARLKLWIVGGTVPLRGRGGRARRRRLPGVRRRRPRVARYDKIHLFDVDVPGSAESYRESAHVVPGSARSSSIRRSAGSGSSVCYDMRFPELYRHLMRRGRAAASLVPAAFTVPTGRAHWEALLRARAIENLCYVVAPAQWGVHANGRETYGDSHDRRPLGPGAGACAARHRRASCADIDLARSAGCAQSFPALEHRVLYCPTGIERSS